MPNKQQGHKGEKKREGSEEAAKDKTRKRQNKVNKKLERDWKTGSSRENTEKLVLGTLKLSLDPALEVRTHGLPDYAEIRKRFYAHNLFESKTSLERTLQLFKNGFCAGVKREDPQR